MKLKNSYNIHLLVELSVGGQYELSFVTGQHRT